MAFESDKKFLTEFIEIYEKHPALWKIKSDLNKNKHLRNVGLDELIEKCKEKYPEADREFVRKKINNLRTFRRELAKVKKSKHTGKSPDNIYIPTLWYFNLLMFTSEEETGRVGVSSLDDEINVDENDSVTSGSFTQPEYESSFDPSIHSDSYVRKSVTPLSKKLKRNFVAKKMEFVDLASETLKSINEPNKEDDECSIVGKRLALQLRDMKEDQRLLTEKIISDVMYYGRIGKLTENSFQYNRPHPEPLPSFPSTFPTLEMYYKQQQYQQQQYQQYFQQPLHVQVPPMNNCESNTANTEKRTSDVIQNASSTAPSQGRQETDDYLDNFLVFQK